MRLEKNYLSDKELEQFILNIEENELVKAPPNLLDKIITQIDIISESDREKIEEQKKIKNSLKQNKVKEFREYCFRVVTSVAAAIIFVFLLPQFFTMEQSISLEKEKLISEIYQIKENTWNDNNLLTQLLGGKNGFSNENK